MIIDNNYLHCILINLLSLFKIKINDMNVKRLAIPEMLSDLIYSPPEQNFIQKALEDACHGLNVKLENLLIEGLKLKGFTFVNRFELEDFIRDNCRCEDNIDLKEKVYFVNNNPFFLHRYEMIYNPDLSNTNTITANYGTYSFL